MKRPPFRLSATVLTLGGLFLCMLGTALIYPRQDAPMTGDLLAPPSPSHPLGTGEFGQDLLLRTILATPNTMAIGFGTGIATIVAATLYASLATGTSPALRRGMMRLVDAQLALPSLVMSMLIAAYIRPGILSIIVILTLLGWPSDVRNMCFAIDREIARDSYKLARIFGGNRFYLLRRHVLPRITPYWIAMTIQGIQRAIIHSAGLAFLGILDPSLPTLGRNGGRSAPASLYPRSVVAHRGPRFCPDSHAAVSDVMGSSRGKDVEIRCAPFPNRFFWTTSVFDTKPPPW